jgi:hypothetical protein
VVANSLQGGEGRDGAGGRLLEAEVLRLGCELVLLGAGVLGEGALADSEHLVARLERGHVLADRLDAPGDLPSSYADLGCAQRVASEAYRVGQPGHEMPDAPVHAGCLDPGAGVFSTYFGSSV